MANFYDLAGANANIDPILLQAIARAESGENDNIPNSKAGAGGRMQFMPVTAAEYGVYNVRDPSQSIPAAARKMDDLLKQHGDVVSALRAYNAGNPTRWNNPETQAYPGKVAKHYQDIVKERQLASQKADPLDDSAVFALPQKGAKPPTSFDDSAVFALPQKGTSPRPSAPPSAIDAAAGQPIDANRVPGIGTQLKVGLATDQDQQRRIMAGQIFPGMPLDQAMSRIGFSPDGRMVAVDAQNKSFFVDPANFLPNETKPLQTQSVVDQFAKYSPVGAMMKTVAGGVNTLAQGNFSALGLPWLGRQAGGALPVVGGIAGGTVAGPASLVLGPTGAAIGAAAGDAVRQKLAGVVDPGSQPYDIGQTGREALLAGGGQLMGAATARAVSPNPLMASAQDVQLARTGNALTDARTAYQRAAEQGIDLSPGQASGLKSILSYEDYAANNPVFADRAAAFYKNQAGQTTGATNRLLATISPTADKNVAAGNFQAGAGPAISGIRTQANKLATNQFAQADAVGQAMTPELTDLMKTPAVQDAMAKARIVYRNKYGALPEASGPIAPPDALGKAGALPPERPNFKLWQETKHVLDDAVDAASRNADSSAGRAAASGIDSVRKRFVAALDEAYPTYGEARAIVAPGHAEAARLESGVLGSVADKSGEELARPILSGVFERSNPSAVASARDAYFKTGQGASWNDGVRSYLQSAIDKASTSADGLNPGMLRRDVWSKPDIQANMKASLTPEQFAGFNNFFGTLEDIAKTFPKNSLTAMRTNAGQSFEAAAANTPGNNLLGAIGKIGSPGAWFRGAQTITDPLQAMNTQRNMQRVIGNLFTPNGMSMLEGMAQVTPGTNKATSAVMQILSRSMPTLDQINQSKPANALMPQN